MVDEEVVQASDGNDIAMRVPIKMKNSLGKIWSIRRRIQGAGTSVYSTGRATRHEMSAQRRGSAKVANTTHPPTG